MVLPRPVAVNSAIIDGAMVLMLFLITLAAASAISVWRLNIRETHVRAGVVLVLASILSMLFGILFWDGALQTTVAFFLLAILMTLWAILLFVLFRLRRI